jgi:nucleotide-binding universal stress UspA family protein
MGEGGENSFGRYIHKAEYMPGRISRTRNIYCRNVTKLAGRFANRKCKANGTLEQPLAHRLLGIHFADQPQGTLGHAPSFSLNAGHYARMTKTRELMRIEHLAQAPSMSFCANPHPTLQRPASCDELLVVGLPVTRILDIAERSGAAMIVMSNQGRTGLDHLMLGSKAEQIVRLLPVSVLIVKNARELTKGQRRR